MKCFFFRYLVRGGGRAIAECPAKNAKTFFICSLRRYNKYFLFFVSFHEKIYQLYFKNTTELSLQIFKML